jgi:DNA invertase Pin-like site-specific DNA recombinase
MKGLRLAGVFEDSGVSGGKPLACRPAGSQLLATAKKCKALVIVAKLDRLFRSVADAANVIDDFDKRGIQLVAIQESFDMTSPYGRAMAQKASVFAEQERAMIRERTRSAMSVKRSRGGSGWDTNKIAEGTGRGNVGISPPIHSRCG